MEKFALGVIVGSIGGALLVANNYKMRTLVRKTQEEVQAKLDQMMDERIRAMDDTTEEIKAEIETKTAKKPVKSTD
jgi:hypothetical protein